MMQNKDLWVATFCDTRAADTMTGGEDGMGEDIYLFLGLGQVYLNIFNSELIKHVLHGHFILFTFLHFNMQNSHFSTKTPLYYNYINCFNISDTIQLSGI